MRFALQSLTADTDYYLDKSRLYGEHEPVMSEELLERAIRDYLSTCETPEVTFNWHGGEPLMAGLDFYREAVALEKKYADGKIVHNTLQTNGTLITPEWADFFARRISSSDSPSTAPEHIHDTYRSSKAGAPSFRKVIAGLKNLLRSGAEFNTLTAVSKASEGHALEIYQFLKSTGSRFMQFLPVVER